MKDIFAVKRPADESIKSFADFQKFKMARLSAKYPFLEKNQIKVKVKESWLSYQNRKKLQAGNYYLGIIHLVHTQNFPKNNILCPY